MMQPSRWGDHQLRRRAAQLALGLLVAVSALLTSDIAAAQDSSDDASATAPDSEFVIAVTVFNRTTDDDGRNVRLPQPDVEVFVTDAAGTEIGRDVTGENGQVRFGVDERGAYTVTINEDALPDGVDIDMASGTSTTVNVGGGIIVGGNSETVANLFVGKSTRVTKSKISLVPQALANGILLASIIAITSVGLSLIYGTTGLSNFAHGEIVTLGAVFTWMFNQRVGDLSLILAAILGIALTAAFSGGLELGVWRQLRRRRASLTSAMVVSIGLALSLRYLVQFFFGGGDEFFRIATQTPVDLGPVDLTPRSITIIVVSFLVLVGLSLFLLRARFGKAIRAVSDNPDLASATGINSDKVVLIVWIVGGVLAGLGGVFYGMEFGVSWDMGALLLLLMFAAITLGGLGNPFGALIGSLVIGIFVELWAWAFTVDLKTVGALVALIILLLVRPQGILGRKERLG
jgi:neutral amino acid transport system permease protein